jgi:deazaflavin-dependent oxidoreductase (nitroreductase family)
MITSRQRPARIWRVMRTLNQRMASAYGRRRRLARLVLLLTTTGRTSGLPRVTPLQYQAHDRVIYVVSARGVAADWFGNLAAHPQVVVQLGNTQCTGVAEPITDPVRIADLLELRLRRHPIMIRLLLLAEGLPLRFKRADLERFAAGKAMAAIRPSVSLAGLEAGQRDVV